MRAVHALRRSLTHPGSPSWRRSGGAHAHVYVYSARRHSSSAPPVSAAQREHAVSTLSAAALDRWIGAEKRLILRDTLRAEHLADLYVTLPTRSSHAFPEEKEEEGGTPLAYGHHLAFFHPRNPERALRADGTDVEFCPPEPFTRRMWAGGRMVWNSKSPLRVGDRAVAVATIAAVEKKGFESGSPMVFVRQKIEYRRAAGDEVCVEEERSHVYLATPAGGRKGAKEVTGLPRPDFTFEYLPTPTTLFRFSALTFNGHYIHLDKEYAQVSEGYPERLVHGPLTALMLLDTTALNLPGSAFSSFEYRAINPIVVSRPVRICGAREDTNTVRVWAEEPESKVVGMTGKITLSESS